MSVNVSDILEEIQTASAQQADAIGAALANELSSWFQDVVEMAVAQLEWRGRKLDAGDVLEWLRAVRGELRGELPRELRSFVDGAISRVAEIADQAATQQLQEIVPGYRRIPITDALRPSFAALAAAEAAGWYDALIGDDRRTAEMLSSALAAAPITGMGARDLTRFLAQQLGHITRHRLDAIVRTELLRAYAARQLAHYRQAPSIAAWRWSATLDRRTCGVCWVLHGQIFDLDQPMIRHPRCRCTPQPVSMWALREESAVLQEGTGWSLLAQMDEQQQARILGPGRVSFLRRYNLLQNPNGWRRLVRIYESPRGRSVGAVSLRELEEYPWGDRFHLRPSLPRGEIRHTLMFRQLTAEQRKAYATLDRAWQELARLDPTSLDIAHYLEIGTMVDEAYQALDQNYGAAVRQYRPFVQRILKSMRTIVRRRAWSEWQETERQLIAEAPAPTNLHAISRVFRQVARIRSPQKQLSRFLPVEFVGITPAQQATVREQLDEILGNLPASWVRKLAQQQVYIVGEDIARARYLYRDGAHHIVLPRRFADRSFYAVAHELGHAIEQVFDNALCYTFTEYLSRQRGAVPVSMSVLHPGEGYRENEITSFGAFSLDYMGKTYDLQTTEVLSMLLEAYIMSPLTHENQRWSAFMYEGILGDDDVRRFALAILLAL